LLPCHDHSAQFRDFTAESFSVCLGCLPLFAFSLHGADWNIAGMLRLFGRRCCNWLLDNRSRSFLWRSGGETALIVACDGWLLSYW
jgi:hypothetical protein